MTNSSEGGEIKIFGATFKGAAARQLMAVLPWLIAVGSVAYSAWGPPARLNTRMVFLAQMMDTRLRAIEKKLKIESPEPLNISDASVVSGYLRDHR